MPKKKYCVELTEEQRSHLLERLGRGERPAAEQTRVRVLLKVDEGPDGPAWTDDRTADAGAWQLAFRGRDRAICLGPAGPQPPDSRPRGNGSQNDRVAKRAQCGGGHRRLAVPNRGRPDRAKTALPTH